MNAEIKERWVKALRGGEYKQGTSFLRNEDRFCCLGVLCSLYEKEHPESKWVDDVFNRHRFHVPGNPTELIGLPMPVMNWAEIEFIIGDQVQINDVFEHLSGHNDTGRTFAQIADAIEEQL